MGTGAPLQLRVHFPQTEEGKQELARRVAEAHADFVLDTLHGLDCPTRQKLELLQAVIDTVKGHPETGEHAQP